MPSSIKLTDPLDILVEYGYLDEDKPYHKALNNAVMDFAENPDLGGEYNKEYVMLLQNEAKKELKLRRKKIDVSKFFGKEENQTTTADSIGTSSLAVRSKTGKIDTKKFIPEPTDENQEGGASGPVKDILSSVISIEETLNSQYQLQLEGAKEQKEEAEKKRRGAREKMLEGAGKIWDGIKSTGEKVIKPFQSIWSKILGFISTIFFGRIFYKILEWMGNKDNHGKIQSIIQFFKDWWPTLLTAYLLFGNSFGRMAVKLGVTVTKFAVKLVTKLIPKMLAGLAKLKAGKILKGGLIGGALLGAGVIAGKMMSGGKDEGSPDLQPTGEDTPPVEADGGGLIEKYESVISEFKEGGLVSNVSEFKDGGLVSNVSKFKEGGLVSNVSEFKEGGLVSNVSEFKEGGFVSGPGGVDKVPARLTAGEFVMSKGAVQKYGADTLANMNAAGGGTNRPTIMGGYKEGGKAADRSHFGTEGYRMGQVLPDQFMYNKEKFTSSLKTKGGEVIEDKETLTELGGSIGMPDLIENQTQLVESIRKVKGYEDINFMDVVQYPDGGGRLVDMPEETLFPILNSSDAWKASDARRDEAIRIDMESGTQFLDPTETAKMVGLKGGGLVQAFQGGGQVRQMGRGASNNRMKLAAQQKKMNTPGTSSGKKTTVAYQDQGGSMKSSGGARQPGNKELPSFSATAMRSPDKIRVLGISV